jgi:hypothetical protein
MFHSDSESDQPVGSPVPDPPWRMVRVCPRGGENARIGESLAVVPGRGCGTAWVRSVPLHNLAFVK